MSDDQYRSVSRRTFLRVGTAAATSGLLSGCLGQAGEENEDFAGFRMGIQTFCFRDTGFGLERSIQQTRDLGLRWIEFWNGKRARAGVPVDSTPSEIAAV